MPTKNPTTVGILRQLNTNFNANAWGDSMPDTDSTALASQSAVLNRGKSINAFSVYGYFIFLL